jgi:GNAT superfamily N-acetyltransferase
VTALRVVPLSPAHEPAFLRLHDERNDAGWCRCVAWHVLTWNGWGERTAEENLATRCALHEQGAHDGLLAFDEAGEPVGWVQLGQRDRLPKLVAQLGLPPDPDVWAVTCFLVAPTHRRQGIATRLLRAAVDHARDAGASRLEGYPRKGGALVDDDAWTGTEALYAGVGFSTIDTGGERLVCSQNLMRSRDASEDDSPPAAE